MADPDDLLAGQNCWLISDGKAGNDVQSQGIANALGLSITVKRVAPGGVHKLLSPWIGVPQNDRFGEQGSNFAPPWPDIAMAIGRLTTPYIRELKRRAGSATFTVILQNPKVSSKTADLFWVPEHDKLRGDNVITSLTAPHGFTPIRLAQIRETIPEKFSALPCPRVAVLLGGSNGDYKYSSAALERLERAIVALGEAGASLLITPSRRTEAAIVERVRHASARFPGVFWDMLGENPYPYFIAVADAFVAPADSINMTGEPCATGKPVYVFHPDGGSAKFTRFHRALEKHGVTRPLPEPFSNLDEWTYAPLNSGGDIARQIAARYAKFKAKTTNCAAAQ
ncbi:mitochondrial fission ELM1 family protein [Hyphomicrobium sp. D-2]|uniref:mitochondrial fission ELM1 family protein n=1 Tax=Hyphomicrobium sp. D-2 TaxID=3041621 RepID=UPI0024561742|nr:mitochondrial fission ELM1 family protein [Hyphomicrobium sp. D-2]MDH4981747.1 mitochondrial fission ELM1 family protein [Hyphomicrobium sp. D-2]